MASVPDPSYITVAEVRDQTTIADLADDTKISDGDLTILIQNAEDMIDAFVGPQKHHYLDQNTDRVFPREMDIDITSGQPEVPYRVSRAGLRHVEWLFKQWYSVRSTEEMPVQHDVESEDIGGDGSYSYKAVRGGLDLSAATLSPNARVLLEPFRSRFAGIDVSDPLSQAPVRRSFGNDTTLPPSNSPLGYLV